MPTHDYSIANATGAAFRADLNNALYAIASTNSSSVEPPVPYAGMLWTDLSGGGDGVVRRRNGANNAWLTDVGIDSVARSAAAAAQATANAALPKAGGTMTGPIVLPSGDPAGLQATSRTFTDATYQLKLLAPVAGSLLVGAAGGWTVKLDPGVANSVLAIVGGLPTYQLTATAAAADSIVRTKSDGTIDASFIPAVASGLKYRGTFKPVVNDEYPAAGDNGSGAGGAPMVGDFWVIDGLTTGGYTYLQGTLAGVTVYNGDSIAYDGAAWYRMGSSVSLQGYMKVDGSTSMAGDLNLGTHNIINVANITARTGTPPTVSGFSFDATNIILSPQRGTSGPDLPAMPAGQLGTDIGRMQLFVGAGGSNTPLLVVRAFTENTSYATSQYVVNVADGYMYRSASALAAGAFNATNWRRVIDTAGGIFTGPITVQNDSAQIWIKTNNGWTYNFALGTDGRFYLSDSANSTYAWYYEGSVGTRFRARVIADSDVFSRSGFFVSDSVGHAVLAVNTTTATPGVIYLRPNGINEALGQFIIRGATGQMEAYGDIIAGGKVASQTGVFTSNIASCVLSTSSAGGIYLRPNGAGSATGEFVVFPSGQVSVAGVVYVGTGEFRSNIASCVLSANVGLMYFRPNGGTDKQAYINNTNGDMAIAGTMYAANLPGSDRRMKSSIVEADPRRFDDLPFYSFAYTADGRPSRGPMADDVENIAPEFVYDFDLLDEHGDTVTRKTLNYGGLAIEMALGALRRIAALEAAQPQPET